MEKRLNNKSWLIGCLGFTGIPGFYGEATMILFLAFFGGFQYYWLNKLGTQYDERLVENKNKASGRALQSSLIFGLVANLILGFVSTDFEFLYKGSLAIFALSFALGVNLWAYLTYKFDKED